MCYLSKARLESVLAALAAVQGNPSLADLLKPGRHDGAGECCEVKAIPSQRGKEGVWYFGIEQEGYVLVRPRTHQSWWPRHTSEGTPLPIRVARLQLQPERDLLTLHHCDNPSCLSRAHLYAGSPSDNLNDAYKRGRRNTRKTTGVAKARPSTPLACRAAPTRAAALSTCTVELNRAFPLAGWHSPSRAARLARLTL